MNEYETYARHLSAKFQEEIAAHSEAIASGKCKDFAEYTYQAGIIRGLMIANGFIVETVQEMNEDA